MSKIVEQRFGDISLGIPQSWINQSVVNFVGPPAAGLHPNVVLFTKPTQGKLSLEAYVAAQRAALLEAALPGLEILDSGVLRAQHGPLGRISFRFTGDSEDQKLRQDQYFLLADKQAITMCLTCAEARYEDMQATFEAMLRTLRVGE